MGMTARTRIPQIEAETSPGGMLAFLLAAALFAFLYFFFNVFVLAFGAVLIAALLTLLARPLRKWLKLRHWAALALVCLLLLGIAGAPPICLARASLTISRMSPRAWRRPSTKSGRGCKPLRWAGSRFRSWARTASP